MKLRSIALVFSFALFSVHAHAQAGVYVLMQAQQFTQDGVDVPPFPNSADVDKPWLYGPAYGAYVTITKLPYLGALKTGPVLIGLDARGETLRLSEYGSQFDKEDGLFSVRVSSKKTMFKTTPYIQGGFGIGHTRVPFRGHYTNNFDYQFSVGADYKLTSHIDWRVVEASAGFLGNYSTGYYPAAVGPNQSNYSVTLGTGLVFRTKH